MFRANMSPKKYKCHSSNESDGFVTPCSNMDSISGGSDEERWLDGASQSVQADSGSGQVPVTGAEASGSGQVPSRSLPRRTPRRAPRAARAQNLAHQ